MKMQPHRSFRLTHPEYMRGKRTKRRLVILNWLSSLLSIAVALLTLFGCMAILDDFRPGPAGRGAFDVAIMATSYGLAAFAGFQTFAIAKKIFIRQGLLSSEEARSFGEKRDWPDESWLEPKSGSGPESTDREQ